MSPGISILGRFAARLPMLEASIASTGAAGPHQRLLAEHCAAVPMRELRRILATDCAQMLAGRMHDVFGVRFPQFVGVCPLTA